MKHRATPRFWNRHRALPEDIQQLADRGYQLLLQDSWAVTEAWREDYNRVRPHGALGNRPRMANNPAGTKLGAASHSQILALEVVPLRGGHVGPPRRFVLSFCFLPLIN